jgi:outer membrane protein OmpA-like peptidoglycan-associated protein
MIWLLQKALFTTNRIVFSTPKVRIKISPDFVFYTFCMKVNLKTIVILTVCVFINYLAGAQQAGEQKVVVYFENNNFLISKSQSKRLDSILSLYHFNSISNIAGFTDSVGSRKANMDLSRQRASTIANYLKENYQFSCTCTLQNFGMSHPASRTYNALNRRVEITLKLNTDATDSTALNAARPPAEKIVLDKLYFKPDQPVLESFSLDYLRSIATILKKYPDAKFEIRGHVNCPLNVPENSDYMKKMNELSEDRAKMVYVILKDNGIPGDKMIYKGMGNTQMIYPNAASDEEKRKNMRVEILILKNY